MNNDGDDERSTHERKADRGLHRAKLIEPARRGTAAVAVPAIIFGCVIARRFENTNERHGRWRLLKRFVDASTGTA